ncbi:MAG: glycosyltransferase family 4 protein [Candidatus Omnitrophica bacterium]|nr:D-inositol-3-phosphate glycosyltransferase [bacterium]NUN95063.1 glycosyltransferase family 4 protein [Candidatus Omnitrophota bacterium]
MRAPGLLTDFRTSDASLYPGTFVRYNRPVRICHFTSTFFPRVGGVEIVVSNLARCQHEAGHRVTVITPKIRGIDNRVEVPYRVVHYSRPSSKRFLTRQVLLRLLWEHARAPFDVLHCHSAYPHGYVSATFSHLTGVPVIVTPHGPTDIMREERLRRNPKIEARLAKGLRASAGITAISRDIRDEILSVGGIPEEKVRIIPNGVTLAEYEGVAGFDLGFPYILAMGRMVPQKGFDHLIRAFGMVVREEPELRLLFAGEGVYRREYEKQVAALNLQDRIRFLGLVQGPQKISFMKGAEFFVCPSRFEPFGIVVLEAMASGVPVVANRVGGIVDIVEDGVHGKLVDPTSTEELAAAITALHNNPKARRCMGEAAEARSKAYDWNSINEQYLEVYRAGMNLFKGHRPTALGRVLGRRARRHGEESG